MKNCLGECLCDFIYGITVSSSFMTKVWTIYHGLYIITLLEDREANRIWFYYLRKWFPYYEVINVVNFTSLSLSREILAKNWTYIWSFWIRYTNFGTSSESLGHIFLLIWWVLIYLNLTLLHLNVYFHLFIYSKFCGS